MDSNFRQRCTSGEVWKIIWRRFLQKSQRRFWGFINFRSWNEHFYLGLPRRLERRPHAWKRIENVFRRKFLPRKLQMGQAQWTWTTMEQRLLLLWRYLLIPNKLSKILVEHDVYSKNIRKTQISFKLMIWNKILQLGDWLNDKFHGEGMFIYQNGNRYEGHWKNGLKHGKGRYFHLDSGQLQEGVWFKDMCVFSTIIDIPYRQCSTSPSKYPLNQVNYILLYPHFSNKYFQIQLQDPEDICQEQEMLALEGIGNVCKHLPDDSVLKIKSSDRLLI